MKTEEELNALKEEVETLNNKLTKLTEDEFSQVNGGAYSCPSGELTVRTAEQPTARSENRKYRALCNHLALKTRHKASRRQVFIDLKSIFRKEHTHMKGREHKV